MAAKKKSLSCRDVLDQIDKRIDQHERTMHADLSQQVSEIKGHLHSLSHDINENGKQVVALTKATEGLVKTWNTLDWGKKVLMWFGGLALAILAIKEGIQVFFKGHP